MDALDVIQFIDKILIGIIAWSAGSSIIIGLMIYHRKKNKKVENKS